MIYILGFDTSIQQAGVIVCGGGFTETVCHRFDDCSPTEKVEFNRGIMVNARSTHSNGPYATCTSQSRESMETGQREKIYVGKMKEMKAFAFTAGNMTLAFARKLEALIEG